VRDRYLDNMNLAILKDEAIEDLPNQVEFWLNLTWQRRASRVFP